MAPTSPSPSSPSLLTTILSPRYIIPASIGLRLVLILYARWQDANSPMKYTDIDYFVFSDASRFVSRGQSPYDRATYRYTPLLAWALLPNTVVADFGKLLFAAADVLAGWLIMRVLRRPEYGLSETSAARYAALWLLNPMVATISTRGSSEGLLGVMAIALVLATLERRVGLAGVLLGMAVHFKIYPFIYAGSLLWWLERPEDSEEEELSFLERVGRFANTDRLVLAAASLVTFMGLNGVMYAIYGKPFLEHSYLHHLTRLDHRHNFSPYNTLLHLTSSPSFPSSHHLERLAFIPQLLLSAIAIPFALAKKDLAGCMLAQTFAFVAFNKVCTSQYFLWYLVFLPLYLPRSRLLSRPVVGIFAAIAWVAGQGWWLYQGYNLEFLGEQTFVPQLWKAGLAFFAVNVWILVLVVSDVAATEGTETRSTPESKKSR